jgi:hypothetical protein
MTVARMALLEAVARRRVVTALYNGVTMKLAPHLLFERHGDLFVSAWNMTKNARPENEPKLGHFKLGGLADVALTEEPFEPIPSFAPEAPRADDTLVLAV